MIDSILVVTDTFDDVGVESSVLSETGVDLISTDTDSVAEVVELAADVDALLVQSLPLDRITIRALAHLKAIGVYGVGTDSIELEAATERGIRVVNVPDYGIDEVSTHALSLVLASIRKLDLYDDHVRSGGWDWRAGVPLLRPSEMVIGLVAYGTIARGFAEKCVPLFEEVLAFDPYLSDEEMDVTSVEFDELLERSDVVSIHAPLTEETAQLLGPDEFRRMKDTAVVVNTSRGEVVDVDALHSALVDGEIAYAGLDVLPSEPPEELPLFELDNVLLTPHVGWYSEASAHQLRRTLAEEVLRLARGEEPINVVNDPVLD
jgi:D-3-phosphoglycerate dehydrogenase